jgi:hypothetical protein
MTDALIQNKEKTIFWTLLGALLLCFGLYAYLISSTIHNVVARENLENQASVLTLAIGSNEFKYISLRNNVTLPLAYSMGFKDVSDKTFVSRDSGNYLSYLSR